jgi:cation:H+ antiporter
MALSFLLLIFGFVLLITGADWLVGGASALAKKYKVSDLAIGLTIVSFGTSAPELVVNAISAMNEQSDIVYGNIVGSNNFNLFIILGVVGIIMPMTVNVSMVWKEIPFSFFAALVVLLLSNPLLSGQMAVLSRLDSLFLLFFFIGFLGFVYYHAKKGFIEDEVVGDVVPMTIGKMLIFILMGLGMLILGGKFVVDSAVDIATEMGVSQKIIGLTIVAAGTSLPELVTSMVAAFKKNSDIAIGNVIGSNIFNILFVLPMSAMIHPVSYNMAFNTDICLLLVGTLLLFVAMFTGGKKRLDRWEAGILLFFYLGYVGWRIAAEM